MQRLKYSKKEEKKRRLKIKEVRKNLWKWRGKNTEDGNYQRRRKERKKLEGELEDDIETIDEIIE